MTSHFDTNFYSGSNITVSHKLKIKVPAILLLLLLNSIISFAQSNILDQKISIQASDISLKDALIAIGQKAGCTFSYSNTALKDQKKLNYNFRQETIREILHKLIGKDIRLQISDNTVYIQQAQARGSIQGSVKTSDGKPAEFVSVGIKGLRFKQVDDNANFKIDDLQAGEYTLVASCAGLTEQSQKVTVQPGQVTHFDFVLTENKQQLDEVVVHGTRTNKFANKESDYIARLPIKNLENPQVYNVVGQALMKEQVMTSYAEAFQNVAGISTSNIFNTRGTSFFLRGFANPRSLRNGLAAPPGAESIEPVNIERVEVLKGPSATLFGSSLTSFGGAVNNVTKKPFARTAGEISYTTGSWDLSRLTLDYNRPLNSDSTLLFRINAVRHRSNTFQDFGYQHNDAVAPSLTYKVNNRLTLQLDAEINNYKGTMWNWSYFGSDVTITNIKDLKIPYKRSVAGNQLLQEWTSSSVYAKADYKISDQWTSSTNFIQSVYNRSELFGMNNNEWLNDSTLVRTIFGVKPMRESAYQFQQNFTGDFKIGKLRNRLVVGLDAYVYRYNATFRNGSSGSYMDTLIMNGQENPANITKEKVIAHFDTGTPSIVTNGSETYSAYASDVINITDRFLAMLSLRVDHFHNKNFTFNNVEGTGGDYHQTTLSPKLGLVYQLVKDQVSVFGNYMDGFSNNGPGLDLDNNPVNYKPSQANQWEGGIKADAFQHKLSVSLSYYDISVKKALRYDVNPAAQDGTQFSRGFEAEVIANPFPGLNLTAGYGYNKSKYEKADETVDGKTLGAPANVANIWISYKIPAGAVEGLGFGFGGNYVDEVTINRPIIIPSYTVMNAVLFYDQPKFRISVKLNNLNNEQYWSWDHVSPQPPRNFAANISYKF